MHILFNLLKSYITVYTIYRIYFLIEISFQLKLIIFISILLKYMYVFKYKLNKIENVRTNQPIS